MGNLYFYQINSLQLETLGGFKIVILDLKPKIGLIKLEIVRKFYKLS